MKTIIDEIEIFQKPIRGIIDCPKCGNETRTLATTNEWKYWCVVCDKRFNSSGEEFHV